ncbi:hypothetical protein [Puia sp.]|jgi:hypothetical protein|uniref:hypothetical protein n=1 Tax=Puia sp. TaxID=2045100 RepID=UPI002F41316E
MPTRCDQYKNDQIMQIQYRQDCAEHLTRSYGFKIWDLSDRFTLQNQIDYFDSLQRLHEDNKPLIETLDEKGEVVSIAPASTGAGAARGR